MAVLPEVIAEDAAARVLRPHYEEGDVWAVRFCLTMGAGVWLWGFTPHRVEVLDSGVLYVESREADESIGRLWYRQLLFLPLGQWSAAVRL
jgi:hypothetical protein